MLLSAAMAYARSDDYIVVVDLDNVFSMPPKSDKVLGCIELLRKSDHLFGIGATSNPYYDLLSLKAENFNFETLYLDIGRAKRNPFTYHAFHRDRIYAEQQRAAAAIPMLCISSFNGMCVYKAEEYYRGSYIAEGREHICEHVTFNSSINSIAGKKILISSELVLVAPEDHKPVGMLRFYLDRLRSLIRGN